MALVVKIAQIRSPGAVQNTLFGSGLSADVLRDELLSWSHQSVRSGIGRARANPDACDERKARLDLYRSRARKSRDLFTGEKVDCTKSDLLF